MIPLYGFLEGDTIGLLLLATDADTVGDLTDRLAAMASVRVAPRGPLAFVHNGVELAPETPVARAGLKPLDRIDVVLVRS